MAPTRESQPGSEESDPIAAPKSTSTAAEPSQPSAWEQPTPKQTRGYRGTSCSSSGRVATRASTIEAAPSSASSCFHSDDFGAGA